MGSSNETMNGVALFLTLLALSASSASSAGVSTGASTCGDIKAAYRGSNCCAKNGGHASNDTTHQVVPFPTFKHNKNIIGVNECDPAETNYAGKSKVVLPNKNCTLNGAKNALEQAGINVTKGYQGGFNTTEEPIKTSFLDAGLCAVNVHWHLGTEHLSYGEYDEHGSGPTLLANEVTTPTRPPAGKVRQGFQCRAYDKNDKKFTTPYNFKFCKNMQVGQTYEVHWPSSKMGACGTPHQYQYPFYDGVFCDTSKLTTVPKSVGVQAQVFILVNDEHYYYPDLMRGMVIEGIYGNDTVRYTGSTTGTTRDNEVCSGYAPITWLVDRKCQLISASSFDKMCADMMQQADDMSGDLHPHGARELVATAFAASNLQRRADEPSPEAAWVTGTDRHLE